MESKQEKGEAGDGTGPAARREIKRLRDAGMSFVDISEALGKISANASRSPGVLSLILDGEIANPPDSLIKALQSLAPPRNPQDSLALNRSHTSVALAALALDLSASAELQLTPAGSFQARDGRPSEPREGAWKIDAEIARRVIARIAARKTPTVIDYEHQTLLAETNGQPAPAAGWFTAVDWREGTGLFATDVTWTERAKQMIAAGEYRYFSPVIVYDQRSGEVIDITMGAITNLPGIDGMQDVVLRAAARFHLLDEDEVTTMKELLKKLLAALALAETTTEDAAIAAVTALKAKADKTAELETQVAALKTQTPDPAKFVPVAAMQDLQTKVAALSGAIAKRDLDELIEGAMSEGKLMPAQENWARNLGAKDMEALRGYVASAQALPALRGTQTRNSGPGAPAGGDFVAAAKAKFAADAAIREEFGTLEVYTAWCKAEAGGKVKILGRQAA